LSFSDIFGDITDFLSGAVKRTRSSWLFILYVSFFIC